MKGVYLHLIADTLGSVVVVIVAGVVYFTEKTRKAAQVKGKDVMPWKLLDYLDPVLTVIIVILICCSTIPLGKVLQELYFKNFNSLFSLSFTLISNCILTVQETSLVLLQTTPSHIDVNITLFPSNPVVNMIPELLYNVLLLFQIEQLKKKLLNEVDGVLGVHEFHVWQLSGERIVGSIHIRFLNYT